MVYMTVLNALANIAAMVESQISCYERINQYAPYLAHLTVTFRINAFLYLAHLIVHL